MLSPKCRHSSSVMKGVSGCSSRNAAPNTFNRLRQSFVNPLFSANRSFLISRYQSQMSCQKNCHSVSAMPR